MAQVRNFGRLWPIGVALIGVAGLIYAGIQWTSSPKHELDLGDPDAAPQRDPGPDEHFEKVRTHLLDDFTEYVGKVGAESVILVSTIDDERMKVPIVNFPHETGEIVKKGDVIVQLDKGQIEVAIAKAKAAGAKDDAERFQRYLENADVKAPCDGVILEFKRSLGDVPIPGLGLVAMTDLNGFQFTVSVPSSVQAQVMHLSRKFEIDLAEDWGKVTGTVTQFKDQVGDEVPVVLALEAHQGLEPGLDGTIRLPTGKKEVGLVPRLAVQRRADVPYVRVWDADSKSILEKTVRTGDELGPDVIILAGVFPGDSVVVPGKARD
jgi:multidrug efflux pump subunit AcrA (membrane-fusion protein)